MTDPIKQYERVWLYPYTWSNENHNDGIGTEYVRRDVHDADLTAERTRREEAERERDEAREYGGQARIRENKAEDERINWKARAEALSSENAKLRRAIRETHKRAFEHKGECPNPGSCMFCDGGLFMCADCGAAEADADERICTAPSSERDRLRAVMEKVKAFHDRDHGLNGFTAEYEILRAEIDEAVSSIPQPASTAAQEVGEAVRDEAITNALRDSAYLAGVGAGWNAANSDNPNEAKAAIFRAHEGYLAPITNAKRHKVTPPSAPSPDIRAVAEERK